MTNEVRIFISYNWNDSSERLSIARSLEKVDGINVFYDKQNIRYGDKIHPAISDLLDRSHVLITLITTSSLASFEVRDELVRAHERGLFILPIVESGIDIKTIPFFLRDANQIRYQRNQFDEVIVKIEKEIEKLKSNIWKPRTAKVARNIIKELDEFESLPEFRKILVNDVLVDAYEEIQKIAGNYSLDIGVERNFLTRAKPIFENANKIYAVSIASVSTFWSDRENYALAKEYLESQKSRIYRLFVFKGPEEANSFKNIVNANNSQYGENGGVFICSYHDYLDFLKNICISDSFWSELRNEDFGYLQYDHQGSNYLIEARLNATELSFKEVDINHNRSINILALTELFESLARMDAGTMTDKRNIVRWSPDFVQDSIKWSECLTKIFEKRKGSIHHFVFFKKVPDELRSLLYNLKNEIKRFSGLTTANFTINNIWLGETKEISARDGKFDTELRLGSEYEYVLLIELPRADDLEKYYSFKHHSEEREKIYSQLDPDIRYLYNEINKLVDDQSSFDRDPRENERVKETIRRSFSIIESLAAHHLIRMDFVDEEPISTIAKQPGIPFGGFRY